MLSALWSDSTAISATPSDDGRTYAVKHNGRDYPPKELLRMIVGDIGNLSGGERRITISANLASEIGEISEETQTGDQAVEEAIDTSLSLEADLEAA